MSLPEPAPGRKRRHHPLRWFVLLALFAAAWSGGWFWLKGKAIERMDLAAAEAAKDGYRLTWDNRQVSGFPFRLDINLENPRLAEPSGWALTAPLLKGEAYIYKLDHWVVVAPQGVTFTRPDGGAVIVQGKALRASLADFEKRPPRIAIEGADLTFSPEAGAKPYFLSAVKQLNIRLIPGPDDRGGVLVYFGGAKMALEGLAARVVEGRTVSLDVDLTLTKMSAGAGDSWADGVRAWSNGGGEVLVRRAAITGGEAVLEAKGGTLVVGPDGRLQGDLDAVLGDVGGSGQSLKGRVSLRDGVARLGPLEIGPSPKLY